ncbi:YchJ family protein [Massilia sp. TS11]|uniref:YchJ family protein n=1 Tax=Massilia sp. TS11 TaxID=2908003 RepID=UPI001EDB2F3E|nr:YchJ family metal-binding protein [Massilia sp. TS11]MCG2585166.1 hypothetical protein [Massilia sp. TS11]
MPMATSTPPCPCGGPSFDSCCGPYLAGSAIAPSAEALMRSRYTAYTRGDEAYLKETWHPSTRPAEAILDPQEKLQWLRLEIKSALRLRKRNVESAPVEDADTVEFVATFRVNGRAHRLHEVSRFVREGTPPRWYYLDGHFPG